MNVSRLLGRFGRVYSNQTVAEWKGGGPLFFEKLESIQVLRRSLSVRTGIEDRLAERFERLLLID
jgi:hypothetical protein